MPRAKRGTKARARRKKVLKEAKGYRGARSKLFRTATEAVDKAGLYAYRDRRTRKRDFRALWITRIGAGARQCSTNYRDLIRGLSLANVELDRKIRIVRLERKVSILESIAPLAAENGSVLTGAA